MLSCLVKHIEDRWRDIALNKNGFVLDGSGLTPVERK